MNTQHHCLWDQPSDYAGVRFIRTHTTKPDLIEQLRRRVVARDTFGERLVGFMRRNGGFVVAAIVGAAFGLLLVDGAGWLIGAFE